MIPPLLVSPLESLSPADRDKFDVEVAQLAIPHESEGQVISIPFPIAMYHRIEGIWIPVSDLGSFHSPPAAAPAQTETPDSVACDEED